MRIKPQKIPWGFSPPISSLPLATYPALGLALGLASIWPSVNKCITDGQPVECAGGMFCSLSHSPLVAPWASQPIGHPSLLDQERPAQKTDQCWGTGASGREEMKGAEVGDEGEVEGPGGDPAWPSALLPARGHGGHVRHPQWLPVAASSA